MKQSIEVIERDEDGLETGRFYFWGKMTIQPTGDRGSISINAPGQHEGVMSDPGLIAAINDENLDRPPYYCRLHGVTGHTEGSPKCESFIKSDTSDFNKGLDDSGQEAQAKP